ncbi:MAG: hypothetical protein QOJ03_2942 [Frankiaceae bacterium]|nr:hypothetical protein [Frankiaceae bacterium]
MRRSQLIAACVALAVVAGGGAVYVATGTADYVPTAPTPTPAPPRPAALPELGAAAVPSKPGVTAALRRALRDPALGGSVAGLVVDAGTGQTLFDEGADSSIAPASTLKLLTAAAAIDSLGADARLTTSVVRAGRTLYLVGGGDVTLSASAGRGYPPAASLVALARRTASAVAAVTGPLRLRYDVSAWRGQQLAPGWNAGYFSGGDVSRLVPLEVDEGRLQPDAPDRTTTPAAEAARLFAAALHVRGVTVHGSPAPAVAPPAAVDVASVSSAPLAALVQRLLTVSDNDLAEALGRDVAAHEGEPATFAGAAAALTRRLVGLGVPMQGVHLYDASGLSHRDRLTPRALVAVLRLAATSGSRLAAVLEGLPVGAASGTLADRYRHGPARRAAGVVRAKTGTLAGVSALAGQVVDADGDLLLFAFVTDHASVPGPAEEALDRLAARLARCGCP